jgi:hypothetical protein
MGEEGCFMATPEFCTLASKLIFRPSTSSAIGPAVGGISQLDASGWASFLAYAFTVSARNTWTHFFKRSPTLRNYRFRRDGQMSYNYVSTGIGLTSTAGIESNHGFIVGATAGLSGSPARLLRITIF